MTRTDGLFIKKIVFVFVSVCLPLSLSRYASLSVCLSVCLSFCLPACLSLCLSVVILLSVCVSVSICLSVCLCVCSFFLYFLFFINAESSPERCWCGPRSQGERRGELYLTPHCHHQNDFRINMAIDEKHCNDSNSQDSILKCCFTSTETVGLLGTGNPGRPPRLSHSS